MQALTYQTPGPGSKRPKLRVVELATPAPSEGEVLVHVRYAGLNHFETLTWRGERNRAISRALKKNVVVSGIEMAGVVASDGVDFKVGEKVVAYTHIFRGPFFHAGCVAVP